MLNLVKNCGTTFFNLVFILFITFEEKLEKNDFFKITSLKWYISITISENSNLNKDLNSAIKNNVFSQQHDFIMT